MQRVYFDPVLIIPNVVGGKNAKDTELTVDSHVPAYGYGKNHGWSRIIRLVRPLSEHAIDLLSQSNNGGSSQQLNTQVIEAQVI